MRHLILVLAAVAAHAAPSRIVSTAPSFTETAFALGVGDKVVAVSTYCHFPEKANHLPRIGTYLKPNVEAIARLKPDLVLVHAEQRLVIEQMKALGLRVLPLRNNTLEEVMASIRDLGAALEIAPAAAKLEAQIRAQLKATEEASRGKPLVSMLFVVGRTPGKLDGMIVVGKGSFLNELIRAAGGRNVFADAPVAYPKISLEAILRLDPDVIVDMGDMAETVGVSVAHKRSVVQLWKDQTGIRAAQQDRVYAVAADIFVVPGPRVSEAAEAFSRMLHKLDGGSPR